jgi:spore coat polysaccharide biosynthesis predicted glycosyltransferase SpsG
MALAEMLKNDFEIKFVCEQRNADFVSGLDLNYTLIPVSLDSDIFDIAGSQDLVWLDGYHFTETFKSDLRQNIYRLIETNDTPYEAKHVDVIFNHTPGIAKTAFGQTTAKLCLGLDYAMLRPAFLDYAKTHQNIKPTGQGVFVCFGGADTFNLGEKFVNRLIKSDFNQPIYWVTNHTHQIFEDDNVPENLEILNQLDEFDMINYMLKSKVLLIPSSVLSYEAIALRKPFFTGFFVENQKLIFEGLKEKKLAKCFGSIKKNRDVDEALKIFLKFYHDYRMQNQQIAQHKILIDGSSKEHITKAILIKSK